MTTFNAPAVSIVDYQAAPADLRRAINQLLDRVWPWLDAPFSDAPAHDSVLLPRSVLLWNEGQLAAYAAILQKTLEHAEGGWRAGALSCVCVHPDARGKGFGKTILKHAGHWLEHSGLDLSVFTCDENLTGFYLAAGWQTLPDLELIGNRSQEAIRSRAEGKTVLGRFYSKRAIACKAALSNGELDLGLPGRQFW